MELTIKGILRSIKGPDLHIARVALSKELEQRSDINEEESLAELEREAQLAIAEAENGFPLTHEQAIVSLWGWTENAIKDLVACWLDNVPEALQVPQVQKLRIPLAEYQALDPEERGLYIVELLDRELNAPLKQGTSRFDSLLEPFILTEGTPSELGRTIYEFSHVRNLIVHRAGIVDRRFLKACPWYTIARGEKLNVSHAHFYLYALAAIDYYKAILQRIIDLTNSDRGISPSARD